MNACTDITLAPRPSTLKLHHPYYVATAYRSGPVLHPRSHAAFARPFDQFASPLRLVSVSVERRQRKSRLLPLHSILILCVAVYVTNVG